MVTKKLGGRCCTGGFFGFSKLESVTHVGENLLCMLRNGQPRLDPERTSALLTLVDAVREMLACIETSGDGDGDYDELIERLTRLEESPSAPPRVVADRAATAC